MESQISWLLLLGPRGLWLWWLLTQQDMSVIQRMALDAGWDTDALSQMDFLIQLLQAAAVDAFRLPQLSPHSLSDAFSQGLGQSLPHSLSLSDASGRGWGRYCHAPSLAFSLMLLGRGQGLCHAPSLSDAFRLGSGFCALSLCDISPTIWNFIAAPKLLEEQRNPI